MKLSVNTTVDSGEGQQVSPTSRLNAALATSGSVALGTTAVGAGLGGQPQRPEPSSSSPRSTVMISSQSQLPGMGPPAQFGNNNRWELAASVVRPQARFGASVGRGNAVSFATNALLSPRGRGSPLRSTPNRIGQSARSPGATQTSGPSKIQLGAHRAKMQVTWLTPSSLASICRFCIGCAGCGESAHGWGEACRG